MKPLQLSQSEARLWAVNALKLHQTTSTEAQIKHLGYVQIDSISVIQRAHHHVLWSRNPNYHPQEINALFQQRAIFEHWGHAASYLPLEDYRYYLPRMKHFLKRSTWGQKRMKEHGHLLPSILNEIRDKGPLKAKDFKQPPRKNKGWWDWKPAKIALELLYWQGELMVCQRDKFQKVYDLKERFLPSDLNTESPTDKELAEFCVHRALKAHGIMSEKEILKHLPLAPKAEVQKTLSRWVRSQRVGSYHIEGLEEIYYGYAEPLLSPLPNKAVLLSPFDNGVIQRQRLIDLFGFTYIFEAYVPAAKRQYGYFTLPILWKDQFVGRTDLKADRKTQVLKVQSLFLEPTCPTASHTVIRDAFLEMMRFCECQKLAVSEGASKLTFKNFKTLGF